MPHKVPRVHAVERRLTAETIQQIVDDYHAGATSNDLMIARVAVPKMNAMTWVAVVDRPSTRVESARPLRMPAATTNPGRNATSARRLDWIRPSNLAGK